MAEQEELYFVGVRFQGSDKTYYYSTISTDLRLGDIVIVNSDGQIEAATVSTAVMNASSYHSSIELKPIIRKATPEDVKIFQRNGVKAKAMMEVAQIEASKKEMPMDFVAAYLSFNGDIITLVYTSSEKRVDFRELLPILGSKLKARVSLRQIASRDRAKMIGGLGICGLPLCCSTFLTSFESISISKMKNQMLAINIPKYSGPCDKLMCCLAYEDETYTLEKKDFPHIGEEIQLNGEAYTVNSFNVISRTVRLTNADHSDFQTFPLEDVLAMKKGNYTPKKEEPTVEKEYSLPDFNIGRKENQSNSEKTPNDGKNAKNNRELQEKNNNQNRNRQNNNRSEKQDGRHRNHNDRQDKNKDRPTENRNKDEERRNPHHHNDRRNKQRNQNQGGPNQGNKPATNNSPRQEKEGEGRNNHRRRFHPKNREQNNRGEDK